MASNDKLERYTKLSTLIKNIFEIIPKTATWILGLFALFASASQSHQINSPNKLNIPIINSSQIPINITNSSFQFVLFFSTLLVYFHFLRSHWTRYKFENYSGKFSLFLLSDLPRLKKPILLIPFVFFIWIGIEIFRNPISFASHPLIENYRFAILAILLLIFLFNFRDEIGPFVLKVIWSVNIPLRKKWIKRIDDRLRSKNHLDTEYFYDINLNPSIRDAQINWAFDMYFKKYELEYNLRLTNKTKYFDRTSLIFSDDFFDIHSKFNEYFEKSKPIPKPTRQNSILGGQNSILGGFDFPSYLSWTPPTPDIVTYTTKRLNKNKT